MNYPPGNVWHKTAPEIEQLIAPEPRLLKVTPGLSLPAEWPAERRAEFLRRWQETK